MLDCNTRCIVTYLLFTTGRVLVEGQRAPSNQIVGLGALSGAGK